MATLDNFVFNVDKQPWEYDPAQATEQPNFEKVRSLLCKKMNAQHVELFMGSETLANDVIAGQLSLQAKMGLILISGEFGRRLVKSANGAKLFFQTLEIPEGETFQRSDIEQALKKDPSIQWIWGMHCETSTGVLNDLDMYKHICAEHDIKLCLDCICSVGTVEVDLSNVYLASATSGKGFSSIAGLAMVFHNHDVEAAPDYLPCALDLGAYQESGMPYAIQPDLIDALLSALSLHGWEERFLHVKNWSRSIRRKLAEIDVPIVAPDHCAMPAVITIALSKPHCSEHIGSLLQSQGIPVNYRSPYLRDRNWIQASADGFDSAQPESFIQMLKIQLSRI